MEIKAKFENGHFVPLEKVKLDNGEIVELSLVPKKTFSWRGALKDKNRNKEIKTDIIPKLEELVGVLKDLKIDSVSLQHQIKDMW